MRTLLAVLLTAGLVVPVRAQTGEAEGPRRPAYFTYKDAAILGSFVAGTAALYPIDQRLARRFQDPELQEIRFARKAAHYTQTLGRPGALVISGAAWAVGRLSGQEGMADVGWHTAEAILLTEVATRAVKGLAGRARPNVDIDNPHNFQLGRGFGDNRYQSFPSGHSSDAFAAAAAFTSEASRLWPGWEWVIGPVLYTGAGLVGVSRMYNNKHWASDVVGGAALGTFIGLGVVRHHHRDDEGDEGAESARMGAALLFTLRGDGSVSMSLGPGW